MKKILIAGVGSLLNYGCEGIVRGTYNILKHKFNNDFSLTAAVNNVSVCRQCLSDIPDIRLIEDSDRFALRRIIPGILRRIGIGDGSPVRLNIPIVDDYDVFLSAGGDNICPSPDGKIYNLCEDLLLMGKRAEKRHKQCLLWGCSVGPFSGTLEKMIMEELNNIHAIIVREKKTMEYLQGKVADEKLFFAADPAFAFTLPSYEINEKKIGKKLGLNISPLSFGTCEGSIYDFCDKFSLWFNKQYFQELVLIPHVMSSDDGAQNDWLFLSKMEQILHSKIQNKKITLLPPKIGALKTKIEISKLDMLIAARMHCCVAGCSLGIPTVFLTYSPKGIGMCDYVYSGEQKSFPIENVFNDIFYEDLDSFLEHRDKLEQVLFARHDKYLADAMSAADLIL